MQSILICTEFLDPDVLIGELWERGTAGIIEEGKDLRVFFEDDADLRSIYQAFGDAIVEKRQGEMADLEQFERKDWDGIPVGKRFYVAPSWTNCVVPAGRIRLTIDTSIAFGTGRHESTQLGIEALERHVSQGATVLDVGCGSGILSLAASLLGAGQVVSCDVDSNAVVSALQIVRSPVFLGSADAVRTASTDLVVANISAHVVDALTSEFCRIVRPDGLLILAGFVRDNPPQQWIPEEVLESGDWLAWICRPGSVRAAPNKIGQPIATWW